MDKLAEILGDIEAVEKQLLALRDGMNTPSKPQVKTASAEPQQNDFGRISNRVQGQGNPLLDFLLS